MCLCTPEIKPPHCEACKPSAYEQLAEQWEHRARRRFKDAEAEKDPMGRRCIENGAMAYFNAAQELRQVLAKQWA